MSAYDHSLVDGIFDSLAARRRREVLHYLLNAEAEQASFDTLVDYVVEAETHSPASDRGAVAASLHHQHLPKLADEGLIDYDCEHGSITTTAETELAEPYLNIARRRESELRG